MSYGNARKNTSFCEKNLKFKLSVCWCRNVVETKNY